MSDLGYIKGYTELSNLDKEIAGANTQWKSDWETNGEKPLDNYDPNTEQIMPTYDESTFKYGIEQNIPDLQFEDPTFLSFEIVIESDTSPLLNYGVLNSSLSTPKQNSAIDFIRKYNNIDEIAKREEIYKEFIVNLSKIFDKEFKDNKLNRTYIIESIAGLNKLNAKMTKYEEDVLTITLTEDISMQALYLAELYNNLIYSYKNQRYLIPENCLRFDMLLKITDIRTFKTVNPDYNSNDQTSNRFIINQNPSYQIYKLFDCNFDFANSQNHADILTIGGYNDLDTTSNVLVFNIKYKSVSREMKPNLILNSMQLSNKKTDIVNSNIINNEDLFKSLKTNNTIDNEKSLNKNQKNSKISTLGGDRVTEPPSVSKINPKLENLNPNSKENLKDLGDYVTNLSSRVVDTVKENIDEYTDKLKEKFNTIRGQLIQDALRHIRQKLNLPKIYPENVYDDDFNSLSLNNFVRGLGVDIFNEGENFLNDIGLF